MELMDTVRITACDEARLWLSRGLDGDLSGAEASLMYAHIAGCDVCRSVMEEMAVLELAVCKLNQTFDTMMLDEDFGTELALKLGTGYDQLLQFGRHAANDASLRKQLQSVKDHADFIRMCVQLGCESGYSFNAEQVESRLDIEAANEDELSDEQLERVAGGAGGFDAQRLLDLLKGLD